MEGQLVSVIIPIFKAEDFIAETLHSVLRQTYTNLEILLIDDGSPDQSIKVCRQFNDPRIKIIQQANRGLAGARNTGIRNATGEYIALIDADDLWTEDKIEKHVRHLESSPTLGISFSYSKLIDQNSKPTGLKQIPKRITGITPPYILSRNPIGNGSSPVFKRQVFQDIGFFDNIHGVEEKFYFDESFKRAEDVECWLRIEMETSWKCEGIPELLTLYRIHPGGLSASLLKQYEYLERIITKYTKAYPEIFVSSSSLARAYYQRYIARRAISLRDSKLALEMMHKAIASDKRIFTEEPVKTLVTMGATYFLCLVPIKLYDHLEQAARNLFTKKVQPKSN
ncbi:glycosyl transferase family 2 [Leptolyngbya sp. Heron Island J]|uniref:glycosyltransferase family 2 protein n=1 Tax=Leptolyngbya sp. Heron Island J TaxID=1385935 RepID=UPI0003B99C8B|nr:glycosyltransferase family A protein [Leptolyngbya sp. Heron Island J]ESA36802.1 glycosyl transferase family 2 [Leptolyngbya sp. Heron Island J]